MPKVSRSIVLMVSDPHCGYDLGLTNPETTLTDQHGVERPIPDLNESQKFIWETYEKGLQDATWLAGKDPIHLLWMGDLTHGKKFNEEQLSTRMSDQIMYASSAMSVAYRLPNIKSSRMDFGTGVHVFGQGSSEVLLSAIMRERFPKIDTRAMYHGLTHYGGFSVDHAHHGPPPGSRNWLRGNVARLYLQSKMMDDLDAGSIPANLVVRGHYHSFVKTWHGLGRSGDWFESWLVIMPPLCLPGDYTRKVTSSVYRVNPGVVAVEIINDRLHAVHPFTQTLDMRTVEIL